MRYFLSLIFLLFSPLAALAQDPGQIVNAELRPGWRLANGDHMAGLHLRLAPGWKTYWRAPGEAGIPPSFDWRGGGIEAVTVKWPTPKTFHQSGMRSIGYEGEVVLPLLVRLKGAGKDARLRAVIDIGLCKHVCLPHRLRLKTRIEASAQRPDPLIAAALANLPFDGDEAGVGPARCEISPAEGGLDLHLRIEMPRPAGSLETAIEAGDPLLFVSEPVTRWQGGALIAQARISHMSGGGFALDRSALRITVLGGPFALDLRGCASG